MLQMTVQIFSVETNIKLSIFIFDYFSLTSLPIPCQLLPFSIAVQLDDACRYVAFHIGKDWKKLYDRLPFVPPRDPDRRQKDVEVIDNISARQDRTPEESALRSLEKWRSFNRQGDIIQLIRGLRKLNKVELAQKLESRFTIQNVYG